MAIVDRRPGSLLTSTDLQLFAAAELARFKVPTRVEFTDEPLPRTATGKVLKRELKARYTTSGAG